MLCYEVFGPAPGRATPLCHDRRGIMDADPVRRPSHLDRTGRTAGRLRWAPAGHSRGSTLRAPAAGCRQPHGRLLNQQVTGRHYPYPVRASERWFVTGASLARAVAGACVGGWSGPPQRGRGAHPSNVATTHLTRHGTVPPAPPRSVRAEHGSMSQIPCITYSPQNGRRPSSTARARTGSLSLARRASSSPSAPISRRDLGGRFDGADDRGGDAHRAGGSTVLL